MKKAEEDYKVALREFKAIPLPTHRVCFHCQQCVEKYIKAILQENNIPFGKIHDLEALLNGNKRVISRLEIFREELLWLTTFAVEVRYSGFAVYKKDAEKAINFTKKIIKVLRKYFKK